MVDAEPVTLEPAPPESEGVLSNLLALYVHDLSEIFPIEVGADGRFCYDRLPLYWSEPERRFPFLIRAGAKLAGFALAARGSPASDDPDALDVAEFFVLRGYRRSGVGRRAAGLLWDRLRGDWVVRVSEANRAGLPFWRATVEAYTRGVFAESRRPGSPHGWRVFTFASPGPAALPERGWREMDGELEILPFRPGLEAEVSDLIVGIQRGEFGLDITAEEQPDLRDIPGFYQVGRGNFWVAVARGRVVGTISLLDIGNDQGALRKMFVHPDFRGRGAGTAGRLLGTLLGWAREQGVREIFLGTTAKFLAAHRFYARNGFVEIPAAALPPAFPIMKVDTRFFQLRLGC